MRLPRGIRRLFRLDVLTSEVDREIDEEIHHHFEEAVAAYRHDGLDEGEARARARARFGDERAYREALRTIDHGRVRMRERSEWLDGWGRTLAFAWRGLRRSPGFTLSVVSILALGIGANAVMFGVVDRLLLSPPQHVVDADEVKLLHIRRVGFNGDVFTGSTMTYPDLMDFKELASFSAVAGYADPHELTIGQAPDAIEGRVAGASAALFPLLGVAPYAGRFFDESDDHLAATPTAILAHEFWEREMGGDPAAIGRAVDIGQGTYTVIGIAPPGFTGAELAPVDVWLPLRVMGLLENGDGWVESRGWYWVKAAARLATETTVEAAAAEATAAHRSGRSQMIEQDRYDAGAELLVAPIIAARGPQASDESTVARWLGGVSLVVLLIACFNVANLLLARAVRRRRETAVRLTLGVERSRLVRDLLTESLMLAALGAVAAIVVARLLGDTVHQALLPDVAFTDAGLATRLFVFTGVTTLVAGVITGLVPALQSVRTELGDALRAGGRGVASGRSRLRVALLVGQAALSVVLLVGAGLFVLSLQRAQSLDLGFDASRVAVVSLEWSETLPTEERTTIYRDVRERLRRLPGVQAAGLTYTVPFRSAISLGQPRVPGVDSVPRHHNGGPYVNKVGAEYFEALGLTILRGRGIEARDDGEDAPPVAVLSESMADAIWPDGRAVGQCIIVGNSEDASCTEVIGVVENHRRQSLVEDDPHFLYFVNQAHPGFRGPPQALMVQAGGDEVPATLLASLRDEAQSASSVIRWVGTDRMADYIAPQLRSWRLGASMFTVFGLLALVVAGWGLYSTLAFDVALRRFEIGVRSALGAGRQRILEMIVRQALVLAASGTALGLVLAAAGAGFIEPLLFDVSGREPTVYLGVAASLLLVAGAAGLVPALRATRVDAREALQAD